jgi:putative ATP-dependent endonuclease of OLD family
MYQALKSNKGNGYAADLIDLCDLAELPPSMEGFLKKVYADFPKPEPVQIPVPPAEAPPADEEVPALGHEAGEPGELGV